MSTNCLNASLSPSDKSSPYRTEKLEEFGHQSWAEVCWYLNDTREQFRLGGQLASIDGSNSDKSMLEVTSGARQCSGRLQHALVDCTSAHVCVFFFYLRCSCLLGCKQERQKAWEQQSSNTKKWHAQPHPGKPAEGEPEPQKDYETEEPLPEFVLVCSVAATHQSH